MAAKQPVPAVIEIWGAANMERHELADTKDWAILFEDTVLEVKAKDGAAYYYPVDELLKWVVR